MYTLRPKHLCCMRACAAAVGNPLNLVDARISSLKLYGHMRHDAQVVLLAATDNDPRVVGGNRLIFLAWV
jgi:hypothetical protein